MLKRLSRGSTGEVAFGNGPSTPASKVPANGSTPCRPLSQYQLQFMGCQSMPTNVTRTRICGRYAKYHDPFLRRNTWHLTASNMLCMHKHNARRRGLSISRTPLWRRSAFAENDPYPLHCNRPSLNTFTRFTFLLSPVHCDHTNCIRTPQYNLTLYS